MSLNNLQAKELVTQLYFSVPQRLMTNKVLKDKPCIEINAALPVYKIGCAAARMTCNENVLWIIRSIKLALR